MWAKKVTIETSATKEQIWNLYSDVENWNKWDNTIKYSKLYGEFKAGNKGILKSSNGPKSNFELVLVSKFHKFTSRSSLPFTKIDFIHEINEKNGKLFITHEIQIKGLLTFLFSKIIGEKLLKELPKTMQTLSKEATKN
ncbi:hypothetical protein CBLAS_0526 [Campylobacter blaseri]|uniref:Polyketide cyclase n=1 Tax=Campylobacter blaseri TaxID=2042961 RepID=A0A2P8R0C1_9BACT|nr:hypothetical protein [Campylobacter blaseri]PSM51941.1 hypothetical protein CQ405_05085 [Campylobacter blaseri]PSM53725.1 hypothetical protein CRN67_05085 [Campylobacter blaseri]QKF85720.1 hypothetical protein CBLAS_0526 [Campylobacter blaseri]